jgi:hypothetical protein
MKCTLSIIGLAASLSLASVANATVTTWSFGGNPTQVANGSTYCPTYSTSCSPSSPTITVFGEQITNSTGNLLSTPDATESGLFQVNNTVNHEGIGIAPYNPVEGTSGGMSSQDGLTDSVATNNHGGTDSTISNILEIELGSNIAQGTSLSFLLQAGAGASSDQVSVWYADASTAQNVNSTSMHFDTTTALGAISTDGTTSQFTITKNTSGTEFIAIVADCHYLLLDTVTGTTPSVPEPRFYGLLLAGFLGLAGMAYQKRRAAQATV